MISPSLDNIETVRKKPAKVVLGLDPSIFDYDQVFDDHICAEETEHNKTKTKRNQKRASKVANLARANNELNRFIKHKLEVASFTDQEEKKYFEKLSQAISSCSKFSLLRRHNNNGALQFIGHNTCKHKNCLICNANRAKLVRSRYRKFFDDREFKLPEFKKVGNRKVKTGNFETHYVHNYDFFHLTLTLPHAGGIYKGESFYLDALIQKYNELRKMDFFKILVLAGMYTVEFTRSEENGLHIHIHSLLVVPKFTGSRNHLFQEIFTNWNRITADKDQERKEFTPEQKAGILKGNEKIFDESIFNELDSRGATHTGLESLYVMRKGRKKYINTFDEQEFTAGLMEIMKYHFEPLAFNKKDETVDLDLLIEIQPKLFRKQLYRKFGAFHGVKELNFNFTSEEEEAVAQMVENASDQVINPITLEPAEREEYEYILAPARKVYSDKNGIRLSSGWKPYVLTQAENMVQALTAMVNISISDVMKTKNPKFSNN